MPFQSEKQRRYLWANEPEIARDWTNTYGNRIQKNDGGIMHHFQNYAQNDGNNVSVPRSFQARPHSEQVNLAYITPQEQQMLQALKPGTPHRGPMEIPNYDSFDAAGGYTSGTAMSAAETGSSNQRDRAEVRASNIGGPKGLAPGVTSNQAQDLRNSFLNARAMGQRGSGIGGFFGGLGRGLLSFFGGIPGKLMSGIMTAKDWATKKGQNIGQGVQTFAQYPTLDRWLNRNTDKYLNKPYRGQGYGYDFNEDPSGRIVKDPDLYADQMKEFRMRYPLDLRQSAEVPASEYEGMWDNRGITGAIPSNNPIGGVDQFAKEVLGLEQSAFPIGGTKHKIDELPGTLRDYFQNKKGFTPWSNVRVTQPLHQPNEITERDDLSGIEGQEAKLKDLALAQYRVLQKKQGMQQFGGEKMTPKEKQFLDILEKRMKEEKMYSIPLIG